MAKQKRLSKDFDNQPSFERSKSPRRRRDKDVYDDRKKDHRRNNKVEQYC